MIGIRRFFTLSANQVYTNNDVLANTGLFIDLIAGQTLIAALYLFGNATAGGININVVPSVAVPMIMGYNWLDDGSGAYIANTGVVAPLQVSIQPSAGDFSAIFNFTVRAAADTRIDLQAAQNGADAAPSTIFAGSYVDCIIF